MNTDIEQRITITFMIKEPGKTEERPSAIFIGGENMVALLFEIMAVAPNKRSKSGRDLANQIGQHLFENYQDLL